MNREEFIKVGAISDDLGDIAWELEVTIDNLELPDGLECKVERLTDVLDSLLATSDLLRNYLLKEVKIS